MAGLFDYQDPESVGRMMFAAGLLNAGGPSKMPISTGQALAQGLMARQKGATDAATELRRNALTDAQIQKFRSEALYREFLKSKGINPDLPKDMVSFEMFEKMTPDQRKLYLEMRRGDDEIVTVDGVPTRVSRSRYGATTPLTDIERHGSAQAYVAALTERAKQEQAAALDLTNSWDPVNQRYVRTSRLEAAGQRPMPTPPVPRPMPPVGPQPAPTSPRPVQMTPTGDIAPPEGLSPEQLKAWFENQTRDLPTPQPAAAPRQPLEPPEQGARSDKSVAKISSLKNSLNQFKIATSSLEKASKDVDLWSSGFIGGNTSWLPGAPGYNLKQKLMPANATTALEGLKQMRFESPTGAAVGNVALGELEIFMSKLGSLDVGQKPSQLKEAIKEVIGHYTFAMKNFEKALEAEERYLNGGQSSAPATGSIEEQAKAELARRAGKR